MLLPAPGRGLHAFAAIAQGEPADIFAAGEVAYKADIFAAGAKQLGSIAKGLGGDSEAVFGWLGASGIDPRTRPEAVPLPLWELLDETVSEGEK